MHNLNKLVRFYSFCVCLSTPFYWTISITQVSKVTHFIDASAVYGSDEKTKSEVRSFQGGRLRMLDDFGRQLLPLTTDKKTCVTLDKGACFFAGKT